MTKILAAVAVCVLALLTAPWAASSQGDLSISGRVWLDENADGHRQLSEERLGYYALTLHSGGEQVDRVGTDDSGQYTFDGLDAGRYTVRIEPGGSYILTHPEREYERPFEVAVILEESAARNVDFGLHAPYGSPHFRGLAWVDAVPVIQPDVRAWIDGADCTGPHTLVLPPHGNPAAFSISALSEDLKLGCGTPGDTITFTIDGRRANQTVAWEARDPDERFIGFGSNLTLTAGAPFAHLRAQLAESGEELGFGLYRRLVVAMIDGQVCSVTRGDGFGSALIGVPSEEQVPGCGRFGKVVTFAIDGFAVPEIVLWQAGERPDVAFTFEPSQDAPLAGPAFAYFELAPESDQEILRVNTYVGDVFCGGTVGEAGDTLLVAVAPDELIEGCGREGALVAIEVNGAAFGVPVSWEPGFHEGPGVSSGSGESPPSPVTPGGSQVTPPNAGSAGLKPTSAPVAPARAASALRPAASPAASRCPPSCSSAPA